MKRHWDPLKFERIRQIGLIWQKGKFHFKKPRLIVDFIYLSNNHFVKEQFGTNGKLFYISKKITQIKIKIILKSQSLRKHLGIIPSSFSQCSKLVFKFVILQSDKSDYWQCVCFNWNHIKGMKIATNTTGAKLGLMNL